MNNFNYYYFAIDFLYDALRSLRKGVYYMHGSDEADACRLVASALSKQYPHAELLACKRLPDPTKPNVFLTVMPSNDDLKRYVIAKTLYPLGSNKASFSRDPRYFDTPHEAAATAVAMAYWNNRIGSIDFWANWFAVPVII